MKTFVLLTDFGTQDGYTAVMEGIIRSLCSENVNVIHLTHYIPPQNVDYAKYVIWATHNFFPINSVFICVVDPGVGTNRKILIAKTPLYSFIAPDNGLLNYIIYEYNENIEIYEVDTKEFNILKTPIVQRMLNKKISSTFHGRDIFTPLGVFYNQNPEVVLKYSKKITKKVKNPFVLYDKDINSYKLKIIYSDRFGNVFTNLRFTDGNFKINKVLLKYGNKELEVLFKPSFGYVNVGEPVAYLGSTGLLEIGINGGNAYKSLGFENIKNLKVNFY